MYACESLLYSESSVTLGPFDEFSHLNRNDTVDSFLVLCLWYKNLCIKFYLRLLGAGTCKARVYCFILIPASSAVHGRTATVCRIDDQAVSLSDDEALPHLTSLEMSRPCDSHCWPR